MIDSTDIRNKWLDEKFEHVNTILTHVKDAVDKVREDQSRFINRCDCEMNHVKTRLRDIERRHDEMIGVNKNINETRASRNLTWQMLIALGTGFSALAALVGYFMGKA